MADTEDLKSSGRQRPCEFESRPRHHKAKPISQTVSRISLTRISGSHRREDRHLKCQAADCSTVV
jgi:hypothetical protein